MAASKPKIERIEEWVHYCISCSNCKAIYRDYNPSCPSGEKFLFETYFASGRMKLARALLMGKLEVSEDLVRGLFACTTCGSCETQCQAPHQEHIIDVIEATREFVVEKLGHPASNQERLVSTIADETKLNPYNESHDDNSAIKDKYQLKDKAEFCYFIGCTATYREKEIRDATLDLFKKIGVDFTVINEQCCGSPLIRTGQTKQTKALSKYNVEQIQNSGAHTVVTSCAGCYRTLKKDYIKLDHEIPFKIIHTAELVVQLLKDNKISIGPLSKSATYHDPCHLGRHLGVYEEPRALLQTLFGNSFIEMNPNRENAWCCGAGGGVKIAYPDWSVEIADKRIKHAFDTKADYIVSTCPFCKRNLRDAMIQHKTGVQVIDLIELLNQAEITRIPEKN